MLLILIYPRFILTPMAPEFEKARGSLDNEGDGGLRQQKKRKKDGTLITLKFAV